MGFDSVIQPLVDRRLSGAALCSSLGAFFCSFLFLYCPSDIYTLGLKDLFSQSAILLSFASALLLIPILILRRSSMQASPAIYSNNIQWIYQSLRFSVVISVLVHLAATITLSALFNYMRDISYPMLIRSKGAYAPHLNPKFVYMCGVYLAVGPIYALYRYIQQADILRFPPIQRSMRVWFKSVITKSIVRGVRLGCCLSVVCWFSFFFAGWPLYYALDSTLQHWKFTLSSTPRVLLTCLTDLQLFMRACLTASFVIVLLEIAHDQFSLHTTSIILENPSVSLLIASFNENLSSYNTYLAIFQIKWAVQFSPALRQKVFNDIDTDCSAWKLISTALITRLNNLRLAFEADMEIKKTRSELSTEENTFSEPPISNGLVFGDQSTHKSTPISPTQTGIIYPAQKPSVLRNAASFILEPTVSGGNIFMSDGRTPELVQGSVELETSLEVPRLLRRKNWSNADQAHAPKPAANVSIISIPGSQDVMNAIAQMITSWSFGLQLMGETVVRKAACITKDIQLDIWTIESLSSLVVASTHEDKYGMVHRDVPHILNTLTLLLITMERFVTHVHRDGSGRPMAAGILWKRHTARSATWVVPQELHICLLVLQNSIYRIVTTYYSHLSRFDLLPETAARLQQFLDFHE
ncbi:Nuclear pore complex subunit [Batrachochytrium dendrobatidis]|nr:Nuclear pore complex subunit [Batrachochytrium dendrobatidis]